MVPAVIGLASMMNTFSHAHTPIVLSLLRTVHGIWLGIIIGVLLVFALKWFSAARDRRQSVAAAR
jgi:NhaP-type Na+/H+ or K+/H+ antiporter